MRLQKIISQNNMRRVLTITLFLVFMTVSMRATQPAAITSNFAVDAPRFYVLGMKDGKYKMLRLSEALTEADKYLFRLDKEKIKLDVGDGIKAWASVEEIEPVLQRRCSRILSIAKENDHRSILLGAWGCGVFGNNPSTVARVFHDALKSPAFSSAFDRVVFAIYDQSKEQETLRAFETEF